MDLSYAHFTEQMSGNPLLTIAVEEHHAKNL